MYEGQPFRLHLLSDSVKSLPIIHTRAHTHTHTRTHTHTERINTKKTGCEFLSREFIVILFTSPTHFLNSDEACSGAGYACCASVPAPLCPIPSSTVSQSHSVLFPAPLCPIHTQSHCVPPPAPTVSHPHSYCVPVPLCPIPIPMCPIPSPTVSQSHCVPSPVLLCPIPLCPIPSPTVSQSHCVPSPVLLCPIPLCPSPTPLCPIPSPTVSHPIVSHPQSHCVPVPLCPIPSPTVSHPTVSQSHPTVSHPQSYCVPSHCVPSPVLLCPIPLCPIPSPTLSQSHCVPVPLCPIPSPTVSHPTMPIPSPTPLCPIPSPTVSHPIVSHPQSYCVPSQSHCVLSPVILSIPIMSHPECDLSPFPLCPISTVSHPQSHCVPSPFPSCPIPSHTLSYFHCVPSPFPLCPIPSVSNPQSALCPCPGLGLTVTQSRLTQRDWDKICTRPIMPQSKSQGYTMKLGHNMYQAYLIMSQCQSYGYTIQAYTMRLGHNVYQAYHVLFPSLTWVLHNETGSQCVPCLLCPSISLRITVTQFRFTRQWDTMCTTTRQSGPCPLYHCSPELLSSGFRLTQWRWDTMCPCSYTQSRLTQWEWDIQYIPGLPHPSPHVTQWNWDTVCPCSHTIQAYTMRVGHTMCTGPTTSQSSCYTMKLGHSASLQLHNPGLHNESGMQCVPGLPVSHNETQNHDTMHLCSYTIQAYTMRVGCNVYLAYLCYTMKLITETQCILAVTQSRPTQREWDALYTRPVSRTQS